MTNFLKAVLIAVMIQSPHAYADEVRGGGPPNTPVPTTRPATPAPAQVVVTPEFLRHRVLENNLSLEQELNVVKDQKDRMNVARAQLLPSLNLGMLLFGGPMFLLSSISFLLPFLFPSNWMALDAATDQFNAEKVSYKIMEMNVYGSSLAMYYTILADYKVQKIYEAQAKDLMSIYKIKKNLYDFLGTVTPEDLSQTLATAQLAAATASQLKEMSGQELASLRQVMGLPITTEILFDDQNMPISEWELRPLGDVVTQALTLAPENQQIDFLIKAAEAKKLSAQFGFLNSGSLSSVASGGQGASFGNMTGSVSFHFGFDYFPNLSLSERNIDEVKLQKTALEQMLTRTLESVSGSLVEAKLQHELTSSAESELVKVYQITQEKYNQGLTSLVNVLMSHSQLTQAAVAKVKAEMDLNQQRVNLHRALVSDQFSQIKGCAITPVQKKSNIWDAFKPAPQANKTLDQLCQEDGVR